ncbi:MAG: hypothetical protein KA764_09225 [Anaerolineales bacterium]|nr:hypothetical protein [Anaerolineales bacterium]
MTDSTSLPNVGATLTQKQEATLAYTFENDPDEWLVLLAAFIEGRGADSETLKASLLAGDDAWRARVAAAKAQGFEALAGLITERLAMWNLRVRQLLGDAGHTNLLRFYLNALIMLKTAKVKEFGPRGEIKRQMNVSLAQLANEAYATLERYGRAVEIMARGATAGGQALSPEARAIYTARVQESGSHVAALLGAIVLFRQTGTPAASQRLRQFVREQLIVPLEMRARTLPLAEQKPVRDHITAYNALLLAADVAS